MKLKELIEHEYESSKTDLIKQGRTMTRVLALNNKNELFLISTQFNDPDNSKEAFSRILMMLFAAYDIVQYVFVSEAWAVAGTDPERILQGKTPSECANRIEIVTFMAEALDGSQIAASSQIVRDPKGSVVQLNHPEYLPDGGRAEGRFNGLLPRKPIPEPMKTVIKAYLDSKAIRMEAYNDKN